MPDIDTFDYRGYAVSIDIAQPQAESDTGVYLTTIAVAPLGPDGRPGPAKLLCKRSQYVYLDVAAAAQAARARAMAYIDEQTGG
ncbi:hypothetical protein CAL14_15200 [Bordetella genomosp. 9]|uniref:hypothetical protein n=1 Tax=Bordetella genomosp. 9 TaxID=1416803 RepID=UPI000A296458|nr:hypothetical protein [Bordetella genomosp. 9]ARP91463.1 hypothetical protein CAL14_15200 [Bordetella genomosp. 9]